MPMQGFVFPFGSWVHGLASTLNPESDTKALAALQDEKATLSAAEAAKSLNLNP